MSQATLQVGQLHFIVVGQLAHFVGEHAEFCWQLVHCVLTVAGQLPVAVPHVFVAHVAVGCAATFAAVNNEKAASATSTKTTVFFICVLLSLKT